MINIDFHSKGKHLNPMPLFSVGADRAAIFLRESHQRDLLALQKELKFKYLRCHGIFNEEMGVVSRTSDNSLQFHWEKVDAFIDQLYSARLRPFIEFGYMPETLARGSDTVFWYRGNSTPPKSSQEWSQLVTAFLRHEIGRFGLSEVRKWFFEVWNEPNLDYFWKGTRDEYFEFYATSARAVKAVDRRLRVGGPSTAGLGWIGEFLKYCNTHHVPVDFVSSHHYGATEGFVDAEGKGHTTLDTRPEAVYADLLRARNTIRESCLPQLPLYITEWGPSYSQVDPIHDNYMCAAYILDKLAKSAPGVDGMSYWAFSDQFEEGGPVRDPFPGGFGLLNYEGLKKPGYFAYLFLAKLQKWTFPSTDERTIATKSSDRVSIVTWDYTEPKLTQPNNPFFHTDIPAQVLPDKVFHLSNLEPGKYEVRTTCVGYMRNDVYGAYLKMGKPKGEGPLLSEEAKNELRIATTGDAERKPDIFVGKSGIGTVSVPMRTNDCWLIEIGRKNS